MKFATLGALALSTVSALATPETKELVAREASPWCIWQLCSGSSTGVSLSLGFSIPLWNAGCNAPPSSCNWWGCSNWGSTGSYTCGGGYSFSIINIWTHVCNQIYYGQPWKWYVDQTWGKGPATIGWQECGAFAQQGISLTFSASFFTSWYGVSKDKWTGFCNDLWNNHYSIKNPCTRAQWQGYMSKWGVDPSKGCY